MYINEDIKSIIIYYKSCTTTITFTVLVKAKSGIPWFLICFVT